MNYCDGVNSHFSSTNSAMGVPFEALIPYAIMLGVRRPSEVLHATIC